MPGRQPINPNAFMYDDGTYEDLSSQGGLGVAMAGMEQNRQRRANELQRNMHSQATQQGFGPLKGLMDGLGLGRNPQWDALFGAMQGKENAVEDQGGRFRFDERSFGNWKQMPTYQPMWDITKGEQSAVGEAFKDSRGHINYRRRGPLQGLRGF